VHSFVVTSQFGKFRIEIARIFLICHFYFELSSGDVRL
jgi:hypothetical protein